MNLNANQVKVLSYLRQYVGQDLPKRRAMGWDLKLPGSTIQSILIALQRGGMIQLTKADMTKPSNERVTRLLFCADVPKVKANQNTPEAARLSWQKAREKALQDGTRRA